METTERIVEAYVRYVEGWATIPNIRCAGQHEIDLLAIDPCADGKRYHIEVGVSISGAYSKLTAKDFSVEALRTRVKQAGQRRTLGYFIQQKFEPKDVVAKLGEYGFSPGHYEKVIVTWGWVDGVAEMAEEARIVLWDFRDLVHKITDTLKNKRAYFTDDTLRTLHLFARAENERAVEEGL